MRRPMAISCYQSNEKEEMGSWSEVVDEILSRQSGFVFESAIQCDFGVAEECISLLFFKNDEADIYFYHVGIGEACRPYLMIWEGFILEEASHQFFIEIEARQLT